MQYLSFAEYQELGGNVTDETTFTLLQRQIESRMNYLTFGRLEKLFESGELPKEVGILEVELINTYANDNPETTKTGVQAYSNGIESYTYAATNDDIDKQRNKRIYTTMQSYLFNYPQLFYRGRR